MIRFRTVLAVGITAAATVTLVAGPAQADTVNRTAHAHFDGDGSMFVDVTRPAVGDTVVDVEWQKSVCARHRRRARLRQRLPPRVRRGGHPLLVLADRCEPHRDGTYQEPQQHCDFVDGDEICGRAAGKHGQHHPQGHLGGSR